MPRKPKVVESLIPRKISIRDELGQRWEVDDQDELWPEVLKITDNGQIDAILPISVILSKRGWGWWSCFKTQDEWLQNIGVPIPTHKLLDNAAHCSAAQLTPLLQEYGAYVGFLEAQVGLLLGRRGALKSAYDAAVMVHSAQAETTGTGKDKEGQALLESETLRQTKRLFIETDMLYETAKGMCTGYVKAYEAVSRIISVRIAEMELSPRRMP